MIPECRGCDACGHIYSTGNTLFAWTGEAWLCRFCYKKAQYRRTPKAQSRAVVITLSDAEMQHAREVGERRQKMAAKEGRKNSHGMLNGSADADIETHVLGCQGELAASKALGIPWPARDGEYRQVSTANGPRRGKPDLDPDIEVKTRTRADYELLVRKDDADDRRYVLVIGQSGNPRMEVRGMMLGKSAKRPGWLRTHGGREAAYFVPNHELGELRA